MDDNRFSREEKQVWESLADLTDPEIPVVTLAEMGILRDVEMVDGVVNVTITPTFSGCPAIHTIQSDIRDRLESRGYSKVGIRIALSPAWTTDWIAESGREKLKAFGISPARTHGGNFAILLQSIVPCPFCGSEETEVRNPFGPTPCRALAYCRSCMQPFEWFRPI